MKLVKLTLKAAMSPGEERGEILVNSDHVAWVRPGPALGSASLRIVGVATGGGPLDILVEGRAGEVAALLTDA